MFPSRVVALLLLMFSPLAQADSVDVNMNNTSAQFKLGLSASDIGDGNAELQGGVLYNDNNNLLAEAGLMAKGPEGGGEEGGAGPIGGGGLKVVAGTLQQPGVTHNLLDIALGVELGYALPSTVPIAVVGHYFGSLKILSFADTERFSQHGVRLEVGASPKAKIYFGYREISFGIKGVSSLIFDMGTHVGMSISF